jgi:hypothetical protein
LPKIEGSKWQEDLRKHRSDYIRERGYDPDNVQGIPVDIYQDAERYAKTIVGPVPRTKLSNVYVNPDLTAAYPAATRFATIGPETRPGVGGSYIRQHDLVTVKPVSANSDPNNIFSMSRTPEDMRSTITHEMQHAVQYEGQHGLGGSPGYAATQLQMAQRYDPAFSPKNTEANWRYNQAWKELSAASKGEYLNQLKELSNRQGLRPRMIFGKSDWFAYGDDYRREAGKMPRKPGPDRDRWLQGAAEHMLNKNLEKEPWAAGLMEEFDKRTAKNAQARANRVIKKNKDPAMEFDTARAKYNTLRSIGEKDPEGMNLYKRIEGEAIARLAQNRMNLSEVERRANYPFYPKYERTLYQNNLPEKTEVLNPYGLDVPPNELFVYRESY